MTGVNGQLGSALAFQRNVIGLDQSDADISADVSEAKIVDRIASRNPDYIIHAAAYTDVDGAEEEPERAQAANIRGTEHLVAAAEQADAHLVYVSTDYVFDGTAGNYKEGDPTNPVNEYGRTKLAGEEIVRESETDWAIIRPSVIFDGDHDNFFTWARDGLVESGEVSIVTDQICSPTLAGNLAEMVLEIGERGLTGVYHTAGASQVSRFEAVQLMQEELRLGGELKPIERKELPWTAERPRDSSLDVGKVEKELETRPLKLGEAFRRMDS